jgi:hypothetical protein
MARPRRATSDAFYDVFADMPLSDQAAALRILEQVHRLAVREAGKPERRKIATLLDPGGVVIDTTADEQAEVSKQ